MHRSILQKSGLLIAFGFVFGGLAHADMHKFTSADGEKHFEAELTQYLPKGKIVEVRRGSGKLTKFKLDVLSEDDQKYVLKRAPLLKIGKDLRITAKLKTGDKVVTKRPPVKETVEPRSYRLTFRNSSKVKMEDLNVEYDLHWIRDNGTGRKGEENKVTKGTTLVSAVMANQEFSFNTDAVKLLRKEPFGST